MLEREASDPAIDSDLAIKVQRLEKRFKKAAVLTDVSFAIPRGTVAVVQGANGSGKTTLVRILATVVTADAGSAQVAGFDVRQDAARVRQRIGVAFVNERSIFWRLTAMENLLLFAATRGVPLAVRKAQIHSIAEELGMDTFLFKRTSDLSTGQRQRVILARAVLGDPDVLLLDEPLRGLDESGVEAIIGSLQRRAKQGASALVVGPTVTEFRERGFPLFRLSDGTLARTEW